MRVQFAHDLGWIEERTGCVLTRNARGIEAVRDSGEIVGMVAYDGWTENAVQAHMAVSHPAVWRTLVRPAFWAPFVHEGKRVLLGVIPAHNARSCALARRFGFREAYRVRDGWAPGDDLIVHEMRREECRWIPGEMRHG